MLVVGLILILRLWSRLHLSFSVNLITIVLRLGCSRDIAYTATPVGPMFYQAYRGLLYPGGGMGFTMCPSCWHI